MDLRVEALTTVSAAEAIADEWQSLHDTSGDVNPFSGPDWALTWVKHFAVDGRREPLVLAVREDDRLVGVAPLYRNSVLRGVARVVQPIGTGNPWIGPYEIPSIAAAPDLGRDVARAVVGFLGTDSASWDWVNLLLGSAAPWFEPEWLPDWTYTIVPRHSRAAVVLDLSGDTNIYAGRRNLKESSDGRETGSPATSAPTAGRPGVSSPPTTCPRPSTGWPICTANGHPSRTASRSTSTCSTILVSAPS